MQELLIWSSQNEKSVTAILTIFKITPKREMIPYMLLEVKRKSSNSDTVLVMFIYSDAGIKGEERISHNDPGRYTCCDPYEGA